jgi:hypothetical protein
MGGLIAQCQRAGGHERRGNRAFESLYDQPDEVVGMMVRKPPPPEVLRSCIADVATIRREAFLEGFATWRDAISRVISARFARPAASWKSR